MADASRPQDSHGKRWSPNREGGRATGRKEEAEDADYDGALDLSLLDDDLETSDGIDQSLSTDSSDDSEANLWDLILQDPTLFINDELEEVSGHLMESTVGQATSLKFDDDTEEDVAPPVESPSTTESSDDDTSSSTDARGDSSGMPDHPVSASSGS